MKSKRYVLPTIYYMVLVQILNISSVLAQCQFSQFISLGEQYFVHNLEYPGFYRKGQNCFWSARTQEEAKIVLSCEDIDIPETKGCEYEKLSISLTGNKNFKDAHNYCGKGTLSLVSEKNLMEIGLFSSSSFWSPVRKTGRFMCTITAIQSDAPTTTTRRPVTCDCGWKQGMRIAGGTETGVNEFPFMAGLVDATIFTLYCGASIISERYALTAAHCLTTKMVNEVGLLVGDHNITTGLDTPYAKVYAIENFILHSAFDPMTQDNDVALVKTQYSIEFSLYVGPVCLPFRYSSFTFEGQPVIALGWGSEEFSGPKSDVLQEVSLNVITNEQCARTEHNVTDRQLCTYAPNKDTCQSDSGGPLVWMQSKIRRLELVAVVSFGLGCATRRPSVNARVTSYLSWIVNHSTDANYCIK